MSHPHTCHHPDCDARVPRSIFACKPHWFSLPKRLRDAIWSAYVPGQEITMTPSDAYLAAANDAVAHWRARAGETQ